MPNIDDGTAKVSESPVTQGFVWSVFLFPEIRPLGKKEGN